MLKIDDNFVELNKKLVWSIVNKYSSNYNKDDLYQVGMIGAMNACKNYDEKNGIKFSTFAYKHILGEILKYIREDKSLKISRDTIKQYKQILKIKEYIYISKGRNISNYELSKLMGLSEEKINEILLSCKNIESLDSVISSDGKDISLLDTIEKKEKISTLDLIELKEALKTLNSEEKKLIYDRYYENKTQMQIAKEKNINQVKVYRYEKAVLNKLKEELV